MDSRRDAGRPDEAKGDELTPEERTSKVGDLGRGSHEQTQGGSNEAPSGNQGPPRGQP